MAGRLLGRLRSKDPGQLVQQCHQAFLKMPFEANPERVGEEVSRLLHSMKVGAGGGPAHSSPSQPTCGPNGSGVCQEAVAGLRRV